MLAASLAVAAACGGRTSADHAADAGASATGGSGAYGGSMVGVGGADSDGGPAGSGAGGVGGAATGGAGGMGGAAGAGGVCGTSAQTCDFESNCTLLQVSCCICGIPTLGDYMAVNTAHASTCACQGPVCACDSSMNPYLGVACTSGLCTGFDVEQLDAISACSSDSDCTLRNGVGCCASWCQVDVSKVVAVRVDAEPVLEALACAHAAGKLPLPCLECKPEPSPPANLRAACVQGRCQVVTQ